MRVATALLVAFTMLAAGSGQASSTEDPGQGTKGAAGCPPQDVEIGQYVQLESTCTWYADYGKGAPLVLVHGGAVDSRWWEPNLDALTEHFHVYTVDLRGHGRTPDVEGPFSHETFGQDVIEFLETVVGADTPATLVGHSTGSVAVMLAAMRRPDLVDKLVLASSGFNSAGNVPGLEFNAEAVDQTVEFLGESYGEVSPHGEEHFRVVVEKLADLTARGLHLDAADLSAIRSRTLVMVSDDDQITLEHIAEMYRAIPKSELVVVPGTSHFMTQEKPELVNAILVDFLTKDPVPLVAPIRRAEAQPAG